MFFVWPVQKRLPLCNCLGASCLKIAVIKYFQISKKAQPFPLSSSWYYFTQLLYRRFSAKSCRRPSFPSMSACSGLSSTLLQDFSRFRGLSGSGVLASILRKYSDGSILLAVFEVSQSSLSQISKLVSALLILLQLNLIHKPIEKLSNIKLMAIYWIEKNI